MGIHLVVGKADGTQLAAVMYDSTNDWAFGPVITGPDPVGHAEAFIAWFNSSEFEALWEDPAFARAYPPSESRELVIPGDDPRGWQPWALEKLYRLWRETHVTDDGELLAAVRPKEEARVSNGN